MTIRTFFLVLLLVAIGVFAALNWPLITAPATLSLGFGTVNAPLGLVMLGLLAAVSVVFLIYLVYLHSSVLLETRRHARELQAHRALADQAEASRFTELRKFIETQFSQRAANEAEIQRELAARMDRLEESVRTTMHDANNTVAAYLGQLEDRLERDGQRTQASANLRLDH